MKKKVVLRNQEIAYELRRSKRAKRLRITIDTQANIVVTLPRWASIALGEDFLNQKAHWVLTHTKYFQNIPPNPMPKYTYKDYIQNKKRAYEFALQKLEYFNQTYNYTYKAIHIKNQKTIWGSCSRKGNLNFNYKIIFLPEALANYIIVHELCHIKQQNHSATFWNLVAQTFPNYKELRSQLKTKNF